MNLSIGNAPCSWGVEFAGDPRNPPWSKVLDDAREAGYNGIELGPLGFMPEDPALLGDALKQRDLTLIGGVLFRPLHDPAKWDSVKDAAIRTCRVLAAHGSDKLVLIDSIAPERAAAAGRSDEAPRLRGADFNAFLDRIKTVAKIGTEEFGLKVSLHAHVAGYVEFEDELDLVMENIDKSLLGLCLDTGHSVYAGFDPVSVFKRYSNRVSYLHFKDVDLSIRDRVVRERIGFYEACASGVFCRLGRGAVDFSGLRVAIEEKDFNGWATVEQDCDPADAGSALGFAKQNLIYLKSVGLVGER
ncbi:MAG: myo-inositol catabolism protein [Rhodanobacter sp.]|nr:MAG: myo-inositol catabolism protein [Rhodanobacter sp.]